MQLLNFEFLRSFYMKRSLEHILPDNLFASPTKSAPEHQTIFSEASAEADDSVPLTITSSEDTADFTTSSPLTIASLKSCYLQMPPRYYSALVTKLPPAPLSDQNSYSVM